MFSNKMNRIWIGLGILVLISACSGYEKLLKSSDYRLKYRAAIDYYNAGEYARAAGLLEQITPVFKATTRADTVQYYLAYSYFYQKDYILASHYFSNFSVNFPNSEFVEDADYMNGYCEYRLSPKPSLDQGHTYKAINAFELFQLKYPLSDRIPEVVELVAEMEDKLVNKSYMNAKLYFDLGDYKAAIIALQNSLNEYPDTRHREEIMFLILKSRYLLADNSVISKRKERFQDTVDEYYSFIGEFPDSKYRNEADDMYEFAKRFYDNPDLTLENQ